IEVSRIRVRDMRLSYAGHRGSVTLWGKGDKERIVPMLPELEAVLVQHFTVHPAQPMDYLGGVGSRPNPPNLIYDWVALWGQQAGVLHTHPHRFRHTFATQCLENKMALAIIQRLLWLTDISTTKIYTQVADAAVDAAVEEMIRARAQAIARTQGHVAVPDPGQPARPGHWCVGPGCEDPSHV